jgi:hypothetical protein
MNTLDKPTDEEIEGEAMNWARFLYSVYKRKKLERGDLDGTIVTREN